MARANSTKASKPGSPKIAGPTSGKRIVMLEGAFSIKEIEVTSPSRRKAAKTKKKTAKKLGKKVARKAKRAAKPKTAKEPATAKAAKPGPVVLECSPSIRTITALRETLAQVYGEASPVVVDASKVESIDTAALQLLVAFAKSRRDQSRAVDWQTPSSAFCETATLLNLHEPLGIGESAMNEEEDDGLLPVF